MYISASYIDIKLNQDYADFFIDEDFSGLIICDGIGEFKDSGIVARTVVELFTDKKLLVAEKIIYSKELINLQNKKIIGGTTLISCVADLKLNKVKIQYLGNGGIIQFRGDFAQNSNSSIPYRYADIMVPHIAPNGSLTKHISNHSGKQELKASEVELKFTTEVGDILLFFSDGIGSLENNFILNDEENRFWRYENDIIQTVLQELNLFLKKADFKDGFDNQLIEFNKSILKQLKNEDKLEDDAALGILITNGVINFYKSQIDG
ncbi:PP2C family serine/threonine-protein phosphatase [Bizionia myxarmorum]|uniref:PPM-type phosphatase domain-containing protein n=1 Tax=Bizionia myxarmorum TaxID=291186 RepID=A0A5D0R033_9FLAO|nr:hypothetical protein [Bizionia myxarmorum]TYB74048.1 hypothetical protein ES674_14955 [Bizionia myxarmorum]